MKKLDCKQTVLIPPSKDFAATIAKWKGFCTTHNLATLAPSHPITVPWYPSIVHQALHEPRHYACPVHYTVYYSNAHVWGFVEVCPVFWSESRLTGEFKWGFSLWSLTTANFWLWAQLGLNSYTPVAICVGSYLSQDCSRTDCLVLGKLLTGRI